jgi:hypothetical protein
MVPWAILLPLLKRVVGLDTLVRLVWKEPKRKRPIEAEKVLALTRLLTLPSRMSRGTCYERSLLAFRFLPHHGADSNLVVGVKTGDGTTSAHAWITVGGVPVGESDVTDEFEPVVVYGRGGRRETTPPSGVIESP